MAKLKLSSNAENGGKSGRGGKVKREFGVIPALLLIVLILAGAFAVYVLTRSKTGIAGVSDNENWAVVLVNKQNPLPKDYTPPRGVTPLGTSFTFRNMTVSTDSRITAVTADMLTAAREAGYDLRVSSGYRDITLQTSNFNRSVFALIARGYTREQAEELTGREIAEPGASEHNAGLALDIVPLGWWDDHDELTEDFADTGGYRWLYDNAYKYGFVLRYPLGKTDLTGYVFEPWHWRYVGKKAAREMYESGLVLEEYLLK